MLGVGAGTMESAASHQCGHGSGGRRSGARAEVTPGLGPVLVARKLTCEKCFRALQSNLGGRSVLPALSLAPGVNEPCADTCVVKTRLRFRNVGSWGSDGEGGDGTVHALCTLEVTLGGRWSLSALLGARVLCAGCLGVS